jgi:hypothetical protein
MMPAGRRYLPVLVCFDNGSHSGSHLLFLLLQALLCLGALAEGAAHRQAPHGMREALAHESTAPLLGYLLSLMLQVQGMEPPSAHVHCVAARAYHFNLQHLHCLYQASNASLGACTASCPADC